MMHVPLIGKVPSSELAQGCGEQGCCVGWGKRELFWNLAWLVGHEQSGEEGLALGHRPMVGGCNIEGCECGW